jgi:hypothetical protein
MDTVLDNPIIAIQFDVSETLAALNAVPLSIPVNTKLRSGLPRNGFAVRKFQDAPPTVKP